ncbi:uncharacterized protein SPPG_06589 [Spizellomyces punctatus DAOM BR117]|uniref:Uncharacterized protein n=1 Tax=Spizellomyces punctatus (strain DAOM BR117) TaxID=645134 RepID=A0A0L0HAK1_SPIPD|nr:uncharacterized protein SPPG_06589 [Spizellomyces punctatus DAOM BR117]KNC98187.1 hypothetical protein SPPG_06589 [Spizellomyces punctatus DAOM BR117]|eukprot:XP_016606227.1 hypothetical protein SPPG_06589 [Spizellomyces punctatus DAOM BR117]
MPSKLSPPVSPSTTTVSRGRTISKLMPKTETREKTDMAPSAVKKPQNETGDTVVRQRRKQQDSSPPDSPPDSPSSSTPASPTSLPKVPLLRRMSSSLLHPTSREKGIFLIGLAIVIAVLLFWVLDKEEGGVYRVVRGRASAVEVRRWDCDGDSCDN